MLQLHQFEVKGLANFETPCIFNATAHRVWCKPNTTENTSLHTTACLLGV